MPTDLCLVFGYVFTAVVVVWLSTFEEEGGDLAALVASPVRQVLSAACLCAAVPTKGRLDRLEQYKTFHIRISARDLRVISISFSLT
jgi:hypothetical protein